MNKTLPKILVILGPTSTGKSDLAVSLAQTFNGEIISADSRQVYTGLDVATGKITSEEMRDIPHHLLSVVPPEQTFSVAEWKSLAEKEIRNILSRGKLPIIVGGTGFYIQSIVDNVVLPEVLANNELRKKLSHNTAEELFAMLQELDPDRAETIDPKNPIRLIRAIEIAQALGTVPRPQNNPSTYEFLQIGLTLPEHELKERIHVRTKKRFAVGMIEEARALHEAGLSYERMRELGLEYRILADVLEGSISENEAAARIERQNYQYSRRQIAWFKRDARIQWFIASSPDLKEKVESLFLSFSDVTL